MKDIFDEVADVPTRDIFDDVADAVAPAPIAATVMEAPQENGFPYPAGLERALPMGGGSLLSPDEAAAQNPPDTSFLSSLGQSTALGAIKSVEGAANIATRSVLNTNKDRRSDLEAQLAELEQNSQGSDLFAQRSRQKAQEVRNQIQALGTRPESPLVGAVRSDLKNDMDHIQSLKARVEDYYGANPESKNVGAQIGRGLGGFISAAPLMAGGPLGLVGGASQMASVAYQDRYDQVLQETGDEAAAARAGEEAGKKTLPALVAYMAGGKLAAGAAGKLLGEVATPLTKGVVGGLAATGSNVAVGSAVRAAEGHDAMPTFENLTMDALFGLVHGVGEGQNASREARQRASEELKARGIPEELATPPVEQGEAGKAPSDVPQPDLSKFGNKVDTETGIVTTPEGHIDIATGEKLDPVREQSLKSLSKLPETPKSPTLDVDLEPVGRDSFERLSGEPLEEGNIAFRDPQTQQVFQASPDSTPEQLKGILDAARAEEESAQRKARLEAYDQTVDAERNRAAREAFVQPEAAPAPAVKSGSFVWVNPDRLRTLRDEMIAQDKKAKAGTLTIGGEKVAPNPRLEQSIKEIDERIKQLTEPVNPEPTEGQLFQVEQPTPELPTNLSPGASNVRELQQKQVVEGADIHKGLRESTGHPPSRELWEKNFLQANPEFEGNVEALDRIYKASTRADTQQQATPAKPMPEVVAQGENPIPTEAATSIKNAQVQSEAQERGISPPEQAARREFGTVWDDASREIAEDPYRQTRLVNELRENPRPVSDTENAMLLHRQIELQNAYDKSLADLTAAYELKDLDLVQEHQTRQREISDQLTDLYQINRAVGTEQGRGLAARKMMAMEDFSLAKMEARMRAEKGGGPLNKAESQKLAEMHEKIASTEKAFEEYRAEMEKRVADLEAEKAVKATVEKVKKETSSKAPADKGKLQKAADWLRAKAEKARADIKARQEKGQLFSGGINPDEIDDYIIIGASKIADGIGNFTKWSKSMVDEFGEAIRPFLKNIFDKSGAALKSAPEQLTAEEQRERTLNGIKARVDEGDGVEKLGPYIQRLAENAVRAGIKEREPLVNAVHTVLKDIVPGITPREVQDAISGYGKFSQLSQDQVKVTLRDIKGQLQQVSKIEDMQAKIAPKKTGMERRTPSAEERRLTKEVNELKKKGGFSVTDPATQLKTALGAIKTRLRNHIEDLDLAISKGERIPNRKGGVAYDTEANALKVQRDALKEQYDAIFKKPDLTDEQRIQMSKDAVERSIKSYEERIKNGELARRAKKPGPTSPELDAMRAERDALKDELESLRAADSQMQEQRAQEGLKKSIAGLEDRLAKREPVKAEKAGPESKVVSDLKARREALQARLRAVREASPERIQERIESAEESLRKSIEEYDKKLQTGDLSKRTTKPPLSTPEIDSLRSELDAMRTLHRELQNAAKPKLSPDEVALKAAKSRLKTMKAQYERKLAAGDFEPKKAKAFTPDPEFLKLKAENTVAKEEYMKALFDARMAARPPWKKIAGGVGEALNTSRAVLTAFDLSAVLRQGGFIALGNPIRAAKAFGPMFRALRSEKNQAAVMEGIKADPMYPQAEQAKLFLSDEGAQSLTKMEEAYASRWASKIPGVGASGRAYSTFLNKLRFDTFKSMSETLTKSGTPTPEEAKAIANYINVATGRGSIHSSLAQSAAGLNKVFFAPRYVTSRFQLLLGQPFYGGTNRTRALVAKEYAKMLAGAATVYGLGLMAGGSSSPEDKKKFLDSKSSDFLKLKFGNTRLDPLFGLIQATTLMSRLGQGKTTTNSGDVKDLTAEKKGPYDPDRLSVSMRFLRTKLAPVPGNIASLMEGRDLAGNTFGAKDAALNSVVPISFGDIKKVMEEQGVPAGTIFSILSLFGAGVQTYPEKQPSGSSGDPFSSRSKDPFKEKKYKGL